MKKQNEINELQKRILELRTEIKSFDFMVESSEIGEESASQKLEDLKVDLERLEENRDFLSKKYKLSF